MAFWGVYLKPNEPFTLHYDNDNDNDNDAAPKRLRVTQATLGDATRNSPARSVVRCSVGEKHAIAICSLSVKELTCCQLELEFEESHDVVFSVVGPRGVYLSGYFISPVPTFHLHSVDHKGQEKATVEIAGGGDHDFPMDELDLNKTVAVKESIKVQNTNIEDSDKNIKGRKRLLKYVRDNNQKKELTITIDHKTGKDGNEDSSFGTHDKYTNRQLSSIDKDQENTIAVKSHSVSGRLLEEKSDAIGKNKKKKRSRKRKPTTLEANDLLDQKFTSVSGITEENNSRDACEISLENVKQRKRKHKRSKDLVNA